MFTLSLVHHAIVPAWVEGFKFFFFDQVHSSYLSLIYMHHLHNNPILLTFVSLIKPKRKKNESKEKYSKKLFNVRNKFYLAYFIVTNHKFDFEKLRKIKERNTEVSPILPIIKKNSVEKKGNIFYEDDSSIILKQK